MKSGKQHLSIDGLKILKFPIRKNSNFFNSKMAPQKISNFHDLMTESDKARRDLSKNIWVVAEIVFRYRDKQEKPLCLTSVGKKLKSERHLYSDALH